MVIDTGPTPERVATRSGQRPATDGRRLDVQGLRAVAVLLVVTYHAGLPIPGGFVGVDVFFVISGFVITNMLHREWLSHGRIRFGHFYLRRFKRLTPALALMVTGTLLLSTLLLSPLGPQQSTALTAIGAMGLLANAVIARTTGDYFDAPAEQNALLHTWSLSVEEQFYLVFPLLLAGCWLVAHRNGGGLRRVAALVVAGACTFSLGLAVANSRGFQLEVGEMLVGFYGPVTRVWEFAAGALLALVPNWAAARTRSSGVVHGLAGVLLLGAAVVLISGDVPFPGPWSILPVLGTVLLIRAGGRPDNTPATLLRTAPMVRLGDWSYSIYLWHWPFIVFAGALFPTQAAALAVAAALSLIPAIASYRWVEGPLRAMELRGARRIGGVALVCLTLPVGLAVLLSAAVDRGFWSNTIQAHQRAVLQPHAGCYGYEPLSPGRAEECTLNASADGAPLYLVGDSHAQHFSEAVLGAGVELERPVVISTATNCPIVDMHLRFASAPPGHNEQCAGFSRGTIAYLATAQAGTVVLATSDRYWTDDEFELGTTASTMTSAADDKLQAARLAIAATVRDMQQAGHDVLLVDDVPRWEGRDEWTPHNCSVATLLTGVGACDRVMPVARAEERQGEVRAVLRDVASSTGSGLLDPWSVLCPDGRCSTQRDGYTAYRDTNHISVPQSRALAPTFRVAIDR